MVINTFQCSIFIFSIVFFNNEFQFHPLHICSNQIVRSQGTLSDAQQHPEKPTVTRAYNLHYYMRAVLLWTQAFDKLLVAASLFYIFSRKVTNE